MHRSILACFYANSVVRICSYLKKSILVNYTAQICYCDAEPNRRVHL